jgi:hypothetical protein
MPWVDLRQKWGSLKIKAPKLIQMGHRDTYLLIYIYNIIIEMADRWVGRIIQVSYSAWCFQPLATKNTWWSPNIPNDYLYIYTILYIYVYSFCVCYVYIIELWDSSDIHGYSQFQWILIFPIDIAIWRYPILGNMTHEITCLCRQVCPKKGSPIVFGKNMAPQFLP